MERVALTVLVLVQTAPLWCRQLPPPPAPPAPPAPALGLAPLDAPSSPEHHEGRSAERFGFPSSNIATPIISASLVSQPDLPEPALSLLPQILNPSLSITPVHSDQFRPHVPEYWVQRPHHRKLRVKELYSDHGKLWTKFPNKKHLVEIVPLRPKLGKRKGKALAYILPKHNIKRKLKEKLQLNGLIGRAIPDLSDVFESSEENSYQGDSSDSENSDTLESSSLESHANVIPSAPNHQIIINDDLSPEDVINNKINDIVTFFKKHHSEKVDSLVQDVLRNPTNDSNYHVHYIIHKHNHKNDNDQENDENTDSQTIEYDPNKGHEIYNIDNDENPAIKLAHQPYLTSSEEAYNDMNYVDPDSDAHLHTDHIILHHENSKDDIDNLDLENLYNVLREESEKHKHSSHGIKHHETNTHHEPHLIHHNFNPYDGSYENDIIVEIPTHSDNEQDIGTGNIHLNEDSSSNEIPLNHIHGITHGDHLDPDFSNVFETITEGAFTPEDEIQIISHLTDPVNILDEHADDNNENNDTESGPSVSESESSGSPQTDSDSSDLSSELSSEGSGDSAIDTSDPDFKPDSTDSTGSSEADVKSEDSIISQSDENNDNNSIRNEEHIGIDPDLYPYTILHPEDILPINIIKNDGDDASRPEDSSSEDKSDQQPAHYDSSADITVSDLNEHHFVLPDCLKKKQKCKKDNVNCKGHKFYKLTFLFNR